MKIAILGTGTVGRTLGDRLVELGHEVKMGARQAGNETAAAWAAAAGGRASAGSFADAAAFAEVVFNCVKGEATLDALRQAGAAHLAGKVLVDVSNPLDTAHGFPPSLSVCNTDSLGEQVQRELPEARVVKSLNTMWCGIMVDPRRLQGEHLVFVCGNDAAAKATVAGLLREMGWRDGEITDLGDITAARGTEMVLPLWLRLYMRRGDGAFNFAVAT
jgi:predicted dinucleotide-binding enzyme